MELMLKAGRLMALQKLVDTQGEDHHWKLAVDNIKGVVSKAIEKFGSLDNLP
ncbi:MAG: hypothetical protein LJE83_10455 [Gammaproteobacteria bacterium]|nr:hypothetical protein [Gammaproteobacteria bacterium]